MKRYVYQTISTGESNWKNHLKELGMEGYRVVNVIVGWETQYNEREHDIIMEKEEETE